MQEPFLVRLPKGQDLLEAITNALRERSVRKAVFNAIGALDACVLGFYDPITRQYRNRDCPGPLEIVSCMGNVSEKDGDVFAHAHAVVSGEDYACLGGHLMPGSPIFAAELCVLPISGKVPVREFDEPTGLALWREW